MNQATTLGALSILLISGAFMGCEEETAKKKDSNIIRYRVAVTLQEQELPFHLEIENDRATLINGLEKAEIGALTKKENITTATFPAFNSKIEFSPATGKGQLTLVKAGGKVQIMELIAAAGEAHRFTKSPKTSQLVSGRWEVEFQTENGEKSQAIALFEQSGASVTGTFMTPLGDYRYLAGELNDRALSLSCFDGGHAFLFRAKLNELGQLVDGHFWSGTQWHEYWSAKRNDKATLPDPLTLTTMTQDLPNWTFPNLEGKKVSLHSPKYKGKVLVISILGSWCPNCHDEAAFLSPLHKEFQSRGVEMVGLMFEHLHDFEGAARQGRAFKKKYRIDYELLIAGTSDKKKASKALPELSKVQSYPTTIFVDKSGRVRKIHTGFSGPATGVAYKALTSDFRRSLESLVGE